MTTKVETCEIIGYWARVHDLTWDDLHSCDPEFVSEHLSVDDARAKFTAGWEQADEELKRERIDKLRESLGDVFGEIDG